ncbi:hypothetical protein MMEU_1367 [Mycobacterium marinum str. Europe]|nr:hypothetical protein MMEU_1367 [Mycobacterium marinum str. Europe]
MCSPVRGGGSGVCNGAVELVRFDSPWHDVRRMTGQVNLGSPVWLRHHIPWGFHGTFTHSNA